MDTRRYGEVSVLHLEPETLRQAPPPRRDRPRPAGRLPLRFADWVRCIRAEPWMGRAQPIHRDVDPFAATAASAA